jgi:hypothetical protein
MRAKNLIKEKKKKKARTLGGFPVIGIYFGTTATDTGDAGGEAIAEFAPAGSGGSGEYFLIHPISAYRKMFKIKLSNVKTEDEFKQYWNQLSPVIHQYFDNLYPIAPMSAPNKSATMTFSEYVGIVSEEVLAMLRNKALRLSKKFRTNEAVGDLRTAASIAKEIYNNLDDLEHIKNSGSKIASGNPHNVDSLKKEIITLHKDLDRLGFEYAPELPDKVRIKGSQDGTNVRSFTPKNRQVPGMNFVIRHRDGSPVAKFANRDQAMDYYNNLKQAFPDKDYVIKMEKDAGTMYEEIKLNAPHRRVDRKELQSYLDRIKTGTKTKKDKFAPIVHGSNIKAITKSDNPDDKWDLDDLSSQITSRPKALLGTNAKMEKSKTEGEIIYDLTLPALSGIVVDEGTGDFVEITTCPGAGECQLFCYARKGGYIMFPASSMSAAQALNFLVNDPKGYSDMVNREIHAIKKKTDKAGIQLVVRWHDAGDFFSKEYLDLAFDVARSNPDVQFYAYTKMGDVATAQTPNNFIINFSSGSKRREEKKIEIHRTATKQEVKAGITVPKDMFYDLIDRDGIKLNKDAKGRTQFKSPEALEMFKDRLAAAYKVNPDTIITYDQMLDTPIGAKPHWNVIVQPGAGDRAANRRDVINSFLMFH